MPIAPSDVDNLCRLARIKLAEEERARLLGELQRIVAYVDELQAVDTEGVEPMVHAVPAELIRRRDEARPVVGAKGIAGAARVDDGQVRVPRVVE